MGGMGGIAGFVQAWIKPSRWWRRHKTVQITVWPRFLAQALCPHIHRQPIMWSNDLKKVTYQCVDCHKRIEETNVCVHAEVSWAAWETIKGTDIPRSFRCNHCGCQMFNKDLPKDVRIIPHPSNSAARDH